MTRRSTPAKSRLPMLRRVYLISEEGDPTYVKIGIADDVGRRMASLQTGNRRRLVVLDTFPGTEALERALHTWFDAHRVQGEWFHFPDGDAVHEVFRVLKLGAAFVEMAQCSDKTSQRQQPTVSNQERVRRFLSQNPGASHRQIAEGAGVPSGSVGRVLRQLNR